MNLAMLTHACYGLFTYTHIKDYKDKPFLTIAIFLVENVNVFICICLHRNAQPGTGVEK